MNKRSVLKMVCLFSLTFTMTAGCAVEETIPEGPEAKASDLVSLEQAEASHVITLEEAEARGILTVTEELESTNGPDSDCAPGANCDLRLGRSEIYGSMSAIGQWTNQHEVWLEQLAICHNHRQEVHMAFMLDLRSVNTGERVTVAAGNRVFHIDPEDQQCLAVARKWKVQSSGQWQQARAIQKMREEVGGQTSAWLYSNWDVNPYVGCAGCLTER